MTWDPWTVFALLSFLFGLKGALDGFEAALDELGPLGLTTVPSVLVATRLGWVPPLLGGAFGCLFIFGLKAIVK